MGRIVLADVLTALGVVGAGAVFLGLVHVLRVSGFSYRLQPTGVHIWYGGLVPGRFIPYDTIVDVRRASWAESLVGRRYGLLLTGAVLLELDRGWWRWIILTPAAPEAFISELRQHVKSRMILPANS